jgi:ABC-type branched-subunit amino acid transport system substrate-binding protein
MKRFSVRVVAKSALLLCCAVGYGSAVRAAPPGAAAGQSETVIRLGALIDQTGSSTTPLFRSAVELAAAQMNEALDRAASPLRFQFVFADTRSDPALTRVEALKLINQDGVTALVTDSSGDTVAANRLNYDTAAGASHKAAITCFQCSSSFIHDPNVTESDPAVQAAERDPDRWTFRVFYNARYEAAVILRVALAKLHKQPGAPLKIGIFADGGHKSFAVGIAETLPALAGERATAEIVNVSKIEAIGKDWARLLDDRNETTGKTDGPPDLVVVAMLPAAATEAIKTYRQGGYQVPILSNNSFRRDYILAGIGKDADGLEGSSVGLVDRSKSGTSFVDAFRTSSRR